MDRLTEAGLVPSAARRTAKVLAAALSLAANTDERIDNRNAWRIGLAGVSGADVARNTILSEPVIRAIVAAAYEIVGPEFGLLVELAAVTGARISQLARLVVSDVQPDRADPRIMMPTSFKGRGQKAVARRPVPITATLASRLARLGAGRAPDAPLLISFSGGPWVRSQHSRPFIRVVERLGLGRNVTIYALRHSSIVRQLLDNVPIRVVAVNHDTSVVMIERNYSVDIASHTDTMSRRSLLDFDTMPATGKVVAIR